MSDYGNYPLLYGIDLSDYPYSDDTSKAGSSAYYNPGYKETLAVSTTGVYAHLFQPTDVQYDPSQQAAYTKLFNVDLQILRKTFAFDY